MRPTTHSIALTLFGFTAGAAVVSALDQLPSIKGAADADHQAQEASPVANQPSAPGFADAVAAAAPAVVKVYAKGSVDSRPRSSGQARGEMLASTLSGAQPNRAQTRLGSGVIIASQGLIATNGHVVRDCDEIKVELVDGRMRSAELLGIDDATDLAVLRAPLPELAPIALGDPSKLRVGDVVLAIGHPYGIGQTVSLGIVSATGRSRLGLTEIEDFIQTDAAINPGNSGGALVDTAGQLVGIATAGLSESGHAEGVGFAIPSTLVMQVVESIADHGQVDRGWIGLGGRSVTGELERRFGLRASSGVLVSSLVENGPAAAAGLRAGDVITAFAGTEITDASQLRELITATPPQREVPLVLWRGSERIEVSVRAAEWIAADRRDVASTARPERE
ncbi:trypsin-like peptidase domain-containing protein [Lamprobacter modestohalophilus]|uniref:S1C family serine protease n=1 Tax=Lamprobacter modestohalophilus TaxID=1064514 RepID=UPI002ADEE5E3|nr:trypsin-like peptidase domain-containing protein [Lamprobacter modestohalophilus]MEA1049266.1 trypsin-like peptidase domain-containing protein [Lamprobacter modestohalophilus]